VTQGGTLQTASNATISLNVGWTNSDNSAQVGVHEAFLLAVDKSIILLQGHNDIDPKRVSADDTRYKVVYCHNTYICFSTNEQVLQNIK
jgi:hypothetical protein